MLGHIRLIDCSATDESEADKFAMETLIPRAELDIFLRDKDFGRDAIVLFAKSIDIDPGVVVGRLQNAGYIDYSWYHDLKKKYKITT